MATSNDRSSHKSHKRPFSSGDKTQLNVQSVNQSDKSSVNNQPTNQSINQSLDRESAKFIEWKKKLTVSLAEKLQLGDESSNQSGDQSCTQSADQSSRQPFKHFDAVVSNVIESLLARCSFDELRCVRLPTLVELMKSRDPFYSDCREWNQPIKFHNERIREMKESYLVNQPANSANPSLARSTSVLPPLLSSRPFALIGRLVQIVDRKTERLMHFVDSTGRLKAHIINADPSFYQRWIIVYRFNLLISHSTRKHVLEIDLKDVTILSLAAPAIDKSFQPIDSTMAMTFLPTPIHLYTSQSEMKALFLSASSSSRSADASGAKRARTSSTKLVHVLGKLISKSPLIGATSSFLGIEIQVNLDGQLHSQSINQPVSQSTNPSRIQTLFILFQDILARIFAHLLILDHTYLFTNLKLMNLPLSAERFVWVLTARADPDNLSGQLPLSMLKNGVTHVFDSDRFTMPHYEAHTPNYRITNPPERSEPSTDLLYSAGSSPRTSDALVNSSQNNSSIAQSSKLTIQMDRQHGTCATECHTLPPFTCFITRQVVPGVFELNHNTLPHRFRHSFNRATNETDLSAHDLLRQESVLWLYLTHAYHPALDDGIGLRPGSRVRISNAHRVYLHQLKNQSSDETDDRFAKTYRRFMGFRCCSYTSVEIVTFSPFSIVITPWKLDSSDPNNTGTAYKRLYRSMDGQATVHVVNLIAQLTEKVGSLAEAEQIMFAQQANHPNSQSTNNDPSSNRVIHQLLGDNFVGSALQAAVDPRAEFFDHERVCANVNQSLLRYTVLPQLSYLFVSPAVVAACDRMRKGLFGMPNHGATACLAECIYSHDCISGTGALILGYLKSSLSNSTSSQSVEHKIKHGNYLQASNTGLMITDSSRSMDGLACVILGDCSEVQLDAFYHVNTFVVVLEARSASPLASSTDITASLLIDASSLIKLYSAVNVTANPSDNQADSHALIIVVSDKQTPSSTIEAQQSDPPRATLIGALLNHIPGKTVSIALSDKCAQWLPLIKIGSTVSLSSCIRTKAGGYQTDSECCVKLMRQSECSKSEPSIVHKHTITELLRYDLCADASREILCSFKGVVVSKEWRFESLSGETMAIPSPTNRTTRLIQKSAPNLKWCLKMRELKSDQVIDVYVDLQYRAFPVAIIQGSTVSFYRCRRLVNSSWRISITCDKDSVIQLEDVPHSNNQSNLSTDLLIYQSRFALMHFWHQLPVIQQLEFCVLCRVVRLTKANFTVAPSLSSVASVSQTANLSIKRSVDHSWSKRINISIECQIDDGTAVARMHADDELAWRLLQLSSRERRAIESFTHKYGKWQFNSQEQWENRFLDQQNDDGDDADYESADEDMSVYVPRIDARSYQQAVLCVMLRAAIRGRQINARMQQKWQKQDIEAFEKSMEVSAMNNQSTKRMTSLTRINPRQVKCGETTINSFRYGGDVHFKLIDVMEVHARDQAWAILKNL